ncbi:hypothetical protein OKW22_000309 [Bacilli bacterium PM5-3]|nr:hypothetical protein [Bacilli bacterium PM5-3]
MEVLLIVSPSARINEIKKLELILNELILFEYKIMFLNIGHSSKEIISYLKKQHYYNYHLIGEDIPTYQISDNFTNLKKYSISNIIILGLRHKDNITKYLDEYIGTNTNLFVIAGEYGIINDGTKLVNDGAYLLNSIYDFKKFKC